MVGRYGFLGDVGSIQKLKRDAFGEYGMVQFGAYGIVKDVCNAERRKFECTQKGQAAGVERDAEFFVDFAKDGFLRGFAGFGPAAEETPFEGVVAQLHGDAFVAIFEDDGRAFAGVRDHKCAFEKMGDAQNGIQVIT